MVTEQQIFDRVKTVLVETFEIDEALITPEARFYEDLDIDSIDAVDLIVKLQPMIGAKKISPADFKQVRTIADLTAVLSNLLNS